MNAKKKLLKAENDPELQFKMTKYLIDGQKLYPQNTSLGIKYLKFSMKNGNTESAIYYSEMLIKGKVIPRNIKKKKKKLINYLIIKLKNVIKEYIIFYLA